MIQPRVAVMETGFTSAGALCRSQQNLSPSAAALAVSPVANLLLSRSLAATFCYANLRKVDNRGGSGWGQYPVETQVIPQ